MWREHWLELSAAVSDVAARFVDPPGVTHPTALIARVHLFATINDEPVVWACVPAHWPRELRPAALPSQPTMSRRVRTPAFEAFMDALGRRLAGRVPPALFKRLDGKPIAVKPHSKDPDATWGRGAGRPARGYKLHAVWGGGPLPEAFEVTPLNVSERVVARRLIPRLRGEGYVGADKEFDDSKLFDLAQENGHRLVARRPKPGTGLGHRYQSPHRKACIDLLEPGVCRPCHFGRAVVEARDQIERDFANLVSFGGGMIDPPAWVRREGRVSRWVHAKLLINAARIRVNRRRKQTDAA